MEDKLLEERIKKLEDIETPGFFMWVFSRWYYYFLVTIFFLNGFVTVAYSSYPSSTFGYILGVIFLPMLILLIPYYIKKNKRRNKR